MSVYSIYIQNFIDPFGSNSTPVTSERLLYSVPITESDSEFALTDPIVKMEMGKTGSFEFSVHPDHPYYNCWMQMKTIMRIKYSDDTLFRGRVLTIDNSHMTGMKKIHLEGDFAFLMDTYEEGTPDGERSKKSLDAYLNDLITSHNSQVDILNESYKKIYIGEVPGSYSSNISYTQKVTGDTRLYGGTSWRKMADALSEIQSEFGGFFRTRYNENDGKCYLDWLDYYFNKTVNAQPIELKENLIDVSSTTEVDNLFTALIPIGSKNGKNVYVKNTKHGNSKYILVSDIVSEYSDSELNTGYHSKADYQNAVHNYGLIFTTQSFSNADTEDKLWSYAKDWIKNNYVGGISNFTISAFDMYHIDSEKQPYFVGDRVRVIYPNTNAHTSGSTPTIEKTLTITAVQYDLHHPEKDTYEVGIPSSMLNKTYGVPKKTSSGGGATEKTAAASGGYHPPKEDEVTEFSRKAWDFLADETYNNEDWIKFNEDHPKRAKSLLETTHVLLVNELSVTKDTPQGKVEDIQRQRSILLNAPELKLEMFSPSSIMELPPEQRTLDMINQINKFGQTFVLDADKSLLTLSNRAIVDPYDPEARAKTYAERALVQVSGSGEDTNTPGLELFGADKLLSDNPLGELPSALINGGATSSDGNAGFGQDDENNWITTLNKNIVWTDDEGKTHTIKGGIHAEDFHVDDIGSFHTKFAAIDKLIVKSATIEQLEAVDGKITTLTSKAITTDNLSVKLSAYAKDLGARNIVCSDVSTGDLHVSGSGTFSSSIKVGDYTYTHRTKSVVTDVTFDQASGTIHPTKEYIYYFGHT